ncbi:hypothetical protein BJY52DRAFT_1361470 [Lactarius psammicola]|nr:hypothetical protein BJY52DRAFT_1361470 [Lactarius psammicola]
MHPDTVAPSLLFISSLASLTIIVQQLLSLHKSRWNTHGGQAKRRILAVSAALFTFLLSTLSGVLGLLASQAWRAGDYSRVTRATVSEKIVVVALQFGLSVYSMFILNMKALVEPIPSPRIGIITLENVRGLTAVMSCPLVAITVISTAFAALQEDYPAARFPAICWLVIFIPLFGVSVLLYLYIRRAKEHPIILAESSPLLVWLVGKGDFQTPASLFDAFWSTCVTFALHIQSTIPDPHPNSPLSGQEPFRRGGSPRVLVHTPRPSNIGPFRPLQLTITTSSEDFRTLQDPFASPSSPLTEKSFPLFEAVRKKRLSVLLGSTRHSSPAELRLPPMLLQTLEDDTPPLSPPATALVRAPKHASISGAFGA